MGILLAGVTAIAGALIFAMGVPLVYYTKRDRRWKRTDQTVAAWYGLD